MYESDSALGVVGGLVISPDGRSVATSQGSGEGDACFRDLNLVFFKMGKDFQSATVISQAQFSGLPVVPGSTLYPSTKGIWQSSTEFVSPLKITCFIEESPMGEYVFDIVKLTAAKK